MEKTKNDLYKYNLGEDALTITYNYDKNNKDCENAKKFNRGVRFLDTTLITGDLPGVAMATVHPENTLNPDLLKLGDLKVKIIDKDTEIYLHEADKITAMFNPASTIWQISFKKYPSLTFVLKATLFKDCGILCILEVNPKSDTINNLKVEMDFGCFQIGDYRGTGEWGKIEYFDEGEKIIDTNVFEKADKSFLIKSKTQSTDADNKQYIDEVVSAKFLGEIDEIFQKNDNCSAVFCLNSCSVVGFCAMHAQNENELYKLGQITNLEEAHKCFDESDNRCRTLLKENESKTGSQLLDAGFRHAVLNLDYTRTQNAWYEGIHCWKCYFPNNFQIGAAVALGQYDDAKKALLFFGNQPEGYATLTAEGKPAFYENYPHAGRKLLEFEGVPYYIYQLWLYLEATGDFSVLEEVVDNLYNMVCDMFTAHDVEGTDLIGWKYASNEFMYQADHLGMPGAGTSPSVMMSGMLELFCDMASRLGRYDIGNELKAKAKRMTDKIPDVLFQKKYGFFANHRDFQGLVHNTHYYTDYIFSFLYSSLDVRYSWQSIEQLLKNICFRSDETGKMLMRVGEFMPYTFGTCNVMPTQMAEAARALLGLGYVEEALDLIESVALSATVYTESPGSFPEQLSEQGMGLPNYMFANPAGSYAYTYISGVFGISLKSGGTVLKCSPKFHEIYADASISTSYADIKFENKQYQIKLKSDKIKTIEFEMMTKPLKTACVRVNDTGYMPKFEKIPNRTMLKITHEVEGKEIIISPDLEYADLPKYQNLEILENTKVEGLFEGFEVYDPQSITLGSAECGNRNLFLISDEANTVIPVSVIVRKCATVPDMTIKNDGKTTIFKISGEAFCAKGKDISLQLCLHIKGGDKRIAVDAISLDSDGRYSKEIIFKLQKDCLDGATLCDYRIISQGDEIISGTANVKVESCDSIKTVRLDISEKLQRDVIMVRSSWRHGRNYQITLPMENNRDKDFDIVTSDSDNNVAKACVIGPGFSHLDSRVLEPSENKTSETFTVNENVVSLELLYMTEVESRLWGCTVGNLLLMYDDGTKQNIPLIVGDNVFSMSGEFKGSVERIKFSKNDDYLNIMRVGCYPDKKLDNFTIKISVNDSEFSLLGVNYCV